MQSYYNAMDLPTLAYRDLMNFRITPNQMPDIINRNQDFHELILVSRIRPTPTCLGQKALLLLLY
jgi:hypothetical protein